MMRRFLFVAVLFSCAFASAQQPEYDFYPEFRLWGSQQAKASTTPITREQMVERYTEKLRGEGVAEQEIARRVALIKTEREKLEAEYWNRFFTEGKASYNRAPNAFLMQMVEGRKPGAALDYGMGEGRNALYLAKLGWEVWGFDPADAAVALAQRRARELGLTLNTAAVRDSEYDFGIERFDLMLFSWTMPLVPTQKVVDALKRGGVVVMECGADFVGRNEMLKKFDPLRIVRYEIVRAQSDFYDRRETDVLRLVAEKP
jgi:protein-L-isoaspartate O-methyltransferase